MLNENSGVEDRCSRGSNHLYDKCIYAESHKLMESKLNCSFELWSKEPQDPKSKIPNECKLSDVEKNGSLSIFYNSLFSVQQGKAPKNKKISASIKVKY